MRWTTVDALTGRARRLFEDDGAPDAERVIVIMGSGAATVRATVARLGAAAGVGVLTVKRFRPVQRRRLRRRSAIDRARIAVPNRTKEPVRIGDPLPRVEKEFTRVVT